MLTNVKWVAWKSRHTGQRSAAHVRVEGKVDALCGKIFPTDRNRIETATCSDSSCERCRAALDKLDQEAAA